MRLIDADALKKRAIRVSTVKEHCYMKAVGTHEIDKAPTIDAVPVVRCKDCKHWMKDVAGCTDQVGRCEWANYMVGAVGYCVYGERRSDG